MLRIQFIGKKHISFYLLTEQDFNVEIRDAYTGNICHSLTKQNYFG